MCSLFNVSDKCSLKGVYTRSVMSKEKGNAAQTKYMFVVARTVGPLYHTIPVTAVQSGHTPAHTYKCALPLHTTMGLLHHSPKSHRLSMERKRKKNSFKTSKKENISAR